MKVLMLGWEFPPFFAGGVGIVCYELTKSLANFSDISIEYVMAYGPDNKKISDSMNLSSASKPFLSKKNISVTKFESMLYAYDGPSEYLSRFSKILEKQCSGSEFKSIKEIYGQNLISEVYMYAQRVKLHYENSDFDVIHAHDWTTIPAALALREVTGKPVIFHVHITELDKTGGQGGHADVFKIEKEGFEMCDKLVCVSNFVRNRLINDYGVDDSKIEVIHNGGISDLNQDLNSSSEILTHKHQKIKDKVVLFAGRMTLQKGPEYFLNCAKMVLEFEPNTKFVMIGAGDMLSQMIELACELGISKSVFFHGSYSREEASEFFSRADVFVMPSVSEPFGIVPLEAVVKGTPTIISKQSGISEVLNNCFKVDFWDIEDMAHRILSLLKYPNLNSHMSELAFSELENFNWDIAAEKFCNLYGRLNND
jgi:glycosyltransferase involved in cell wall biosynthesis